MGDIMEMIHDIRHALLKYGMEPPEVIILKNHDQGMRLLCGISQMNYLTYGPGQTYGNPIEHPDGSVYMEMQIMGVKIRWPANRIALESGDFKWV